VMAPLGNSRTYTSVSIDAQQKKTVLVQSVTPRYFDILRIPIQQGRNFEAADRGRNVLLVNETLASQFWPGESAIGKRLNYERASVEVIGVVKDVFTTELSAIEPTVYMLYDGSPTPNLLFRKEEGRAEQVTALLKRLEPRALVRTRPLSENFARTIEPVRAGAAIAGALGTLALLLASVGIFGAFGYIVEQRTREIGVRMALGARPAQVVSLILRSCGRALLGGLAAGTAASMGLSGLLVSFLYGVSRLDPLAYAAVALLLIAAGIVASYLPAVRATRIDPVRALRWE